LCSGGPENLNIERKEGRKEGRKEYQKQTKQDELSSKT
jgi:hypothetical protein